MPNIGRELLDVPFPKMVLEMALAISKGQLALDRTSMQTALALAKAKVKIIPELYEIVEWVAPNPEGNVTSGDLPPGTSGINVRFGNAKAVEYTLLQAGLLPTFYQFTESIIEVKITISTRTQSTSEFEFGAEVGGEVDFFFGSASFSSHVNYKTSNTYSYSAEGSSLLRTTLKPVPAPARLVPRIVTVDATKSPPTVTFST